MRTANKLYSGLEAISVDVNPTNAEATMQLVSSFHSPAQSVDNSARIERGIAYGPHARNILNIFAPYSNSEPVPVLIFVHGGNFVAGHCDVPDTPFYDNVGLWAVSRGWIGVTVTYRLAPDSAYPEGTDDVADAVEWVLDNIEKFGGSKEQVTLMGTSAGGIHASLALARRASLSRLQGLVLVSSQYDLTLIPRKPVLAQYFPDEVDFRTVSPLAALGVSRQRLLLTVSQRDPTDYHDQFEKALKTLTATRTARTTALRLQGHNHFSAVLALGAESGELADAIESMITDR